jgi:hypothetical protein
MDKIKVKINVVGFLGFLEVSDISGRQVIELTKDSVICKAYPSEKSFIKYNEVPIKGIVTYDKSFKDPVYLPMVKYAKLKSLLNMYKSSKITDVDMELTFSDSPQVESKEVKAKPCASMVTISSGRFRAAIQCSDNHGYMPMTAWNNYMAMEDMVKIELEAEVIKRLNDLLTLYKKDGTEIGKAQYLVMSMVKDGEGVTFMSPEVDNKKNGDEWSFDLDDSCVEDFLFEKDMSFKFTNTVISQIKTKASATMKRSDDTYCLYVESAGTKYFQLMPSDE